MKPLHQILLRVKAAAAAAAEVLVVCANVGQCCTLPERHDQGFGTLHVPPRSKSVGPKIDESKAAIQFLVSFLFPLCGIVGDDDFLTWPAGLPPLSLLPPPSLMQSSQTFQPLYMVSSSHYQDVSPGSRASGGYAPATSLVRCSRHRTSWMPAPATSTALWHLPSSGPLTLAASCESHPTERWPSAHIDTPKASGAPNSPPTSMFLARADVDQNGQPYALT